MVSESWSQLAARCQYANTDLEAFAKQPDRPPRQYPEKSGSTAQKDRKLLKLMHEDSSHRATISLDTELLSTNTNVVDLPKFMIEIVDRLQRIPRGIDALTTIKK